MLTNSLDAPTASYTKFRLDIVCTMHIELPAKLLEYYFLRSNLNKSNINQSGCSHCIIYQVVTRYRVTPSRLEYQEKLPKKIFFKLFKSQIIFLHAFFCVTHHVCMQVDASRVLNVDSGYPGDVEFFLSPC